MSGRSLWIRTLVALGCAALLSTSSFAAERNRDEPQRPSQIVPGIINGTPLSPTRATVINFTELAREEALGLPTRPPVRELSREEEDNDMDSEPGANIIGPGGMSPYRPAPIMPMVASPSPTTSFIGLDDIPMADSSYIIIPPDCGGAVGPNRILQGLNNNYRILNKAGGATILTVGTATFWAPVVDGSERASLTDPRTLYDPYNNCWIAVMQTFTTGAGKLLLAISQTSDPAGLWYLYNFNTAQSIDFPIVGFNKNWISLSINGYGTGSSFVQGINLVVDYPLARTGTGSGTLFTQAAGTHFCTAPCATYSTTSDSLYLVTHLSSGGATYTLDVISGTAAAPVYTVGGTQTRPGGGWTQPSGNQLVQSAPNSGTSICGATPCTIEAQDAQVRSAPVYRGGKIYYTQSVRLTTPAAHNFVQWTVLTTPSGAAVETGRVEDAAASPTNGGKWYSYPHIAVNSVGDYMIGYTQFASNQHPSAGYSIHLAADAPGTVRDPVIFKIGEDYYHKTFTTNTGRNRWGDYSQAQVDPVDDRTLWTVDEYGKTRTGTSDAVSGNSSKWSTYWASVAPFTITASAGPNGTITPNGAVLVTPTANQSFAITANIGYVIDDVLVDGSSVGAVGSYTFTNVLANHTISATFKVNAAVIAAQSTATYICPTNTCVTLPVTINRSFSTAVLGFSVTFQLSANLSLCAGTGSITEGTFLNSAGTTLYNVIDNGGGSYTADGAIIGVNCGPTALTGTLFNVAVTSVAAGGTGSITVTAVDLRDCANAHLPANPGTPGTVPIDNQAPVVTVISPNGGETWATGSLQPITWTATDNTGVANVDIAYSTDGGATYPNVIATAIANTGSFIWTVPGTPTNQARVRVTAHDVACSSGADASDANFTIGSPTITASAGAGGSISPSGAVSVVFGGSQTFTITANSCFQIADVLVDGVSVGAVSTYTFTNVTVDHTIAASFSLISYTITSSAGAGGSISPNGAQSVNCGANSTFAVAADACHTIADVLVDGSSVGAVASYTFLTVSANHTIAASFAAIPYTITASAGAGGSITPSGAVIVNCGDNQTFAIAAAACFHIDDVLVDGVSAGAVATYTFTNVTANHTIVASFAANASSITPVTGLTATQVKLGNDTDGTTKITITYTAPAGAASVEVYRKGFGGYPTYDDAGGSVPSLPGSYPPAGWSPTLVNASGDNDETTSRDYWYYVAYAKDACGNVSTVSNMTGGTLGYHLGDVSDGITAGQGDNKVTTADISLLGAHYGLTGLALAGFEYLDCGPTTDTSPNGRPTTDAKTNFEDLVIYAINYTPRVSLVVKGGPVTTAAAVNTLKLSEPASVSVGQIIGVPVELSGAGDLQALSVTLGWNAAVVEPIDASTGDLISSQGGVMLSPGPGRADAALLGVGSRGIVGEGVVATVRFRVLASGSPNLSIESAIGRDGANHPVTIAITAPTRVQGAVTSTDLFPVIPNPSHGSAAIDWALSIRGPVDVSVYSVDGRRVKTLAHGVQEVGRYHARWNGADDRGAVAKSGVYFVRLEMAGLQKTRLITLVR